MAEMPQTQETQEKTPGILEDPEVQEPEAQEPEAQESEEEESAQTNFIEIIDAFTMGKAQLTRLKQANNPTVMRQFLLNDLYPILIEMATLCNWYTGNLHDRVSDLEDDQGADEGISPEFAAELMEFIGISLQVFGELIPLMQARPDMMHKVQVLVTQAPGLMAKIQDATMAEEEEEEEEEEEKEVPEVVEPTFQKKPEEEPPPAAAAEAPEVPEAPEAPEAPDVSGSEAPAPELGSMLFKTTPGIGKTEAALKEISVEKTENVESISVEDVVKSPETTEEKEGKSDA